MTSRTTQQGNPIYKRKLDTVGRVPAQSRRYNEAKVRFEQHMIDLGINLSSRLAAKTKHKNYYSGEDLDEWSKHMADVFARGVEEGRNGR